MAGFLDLLGRWLLIEFRRTKPAEWTATAARNGRELRIIYHVESVVDDVATFTETTATRDGEPLRVDRASLRFLDVEGLDAVLGGAGFAVEARYGDWSRGPLTSMSDNIVIVARAAQLWLGPRRVIRAVRTRG